MVKPEHAGGWRALLAGQGAPLAGALVLGMASASIGVAVIAFADRRLLAGGIVDTGTLARFAMLLAALLVVSVAAQSMLTALGHRRVHALRRVLIKRLLDTPVQTVERVGKGALFATLASDIRSITMAFVHLPELIYGGTLTVGAFAYLAWLSPALFACVLAWMAVTLAIGLALMNRLHRHLRGLREAEDALYRHFHDLLDGFKELVLNRQRAAFMHAEIDAAARTYRDEITRTDFYHGLAGNWANVMVLGALGLAFYLASGRALADLGTASTFAVTLLFIRTPLVSAVASIPSLLAARVAWRKIDGLTLAPYEPDFTTASPALPADWRTLSMRHVCFRYPDMPDAPGFGIGPIDLTLRRGETVFITGGNGGGKSSFARVLAGLYHADAGTIAVDGQRIDAATMPSYRRLFSIVLSDFHLSDRLLGPDGDPPDGIVRDWLRHLALPDASARDARLVRRAVSQGQRKRLGLMVAALEQRDILLLDEWAADQDPQRRQVFYRETLPRLRKAGVTVVAITHDDRYLDAADRVLSMDQGRLHELPRAGGPVA